MTCTSGTLRLFGLLWHTYKNNLIPFKDLNTTGTWLEEIWSYNHDRQLYTDTIGDTVSFDFNGSGCMLYLSNKSAAGIVDIYLNGEIFMADLDLYTTSLFVEQVYISNVESDFYDVTPTNNTVTVHLKGTNVSVVAPGLRNRRLGIVMVKEFDRR